MDDSDGCERGGRSGSLFNLFDDIKSSHPPVRVALNAQRMSDNMFSALLSSLATIWNDGSFIGDFLVIENLVKTQLIVIRDAGLPRPKFYNSCFVALFMALRDVFVSVTAAVDLFLIVCGMFTVLCACGVRVRLAFRFLRQFPLLL